jgi:drug/metabolite transporter (DMT)-like permease
MFAHPGHRHLERSMWVILSIVTAVFFALSSGAAKALSRRSHDYVVTWAMMVLGVPLTGLVLALRGVPEIQDGFYQAAFISIGLNTVAVTLQVRALRLSPLSLTMPFLAFTPLFMLVTSSFILGEFPTLKGLAGIILIVSGAYSINLDRLKDGGVTAPIRAIASEPGSRLMLAVAAIWSVAAAYDKVATVASSPAFYTTFFAAVYGVVYLPLLVVGLRRSETTWRDVPGLFILGALSAGMILAQMTAIQMTIASYVIAIKRSGMVVSVLLGYLFFKERHLRTRFAGAALMTLGVVVLSL